MPLSQCEPSSSAERLRGDRTPVANLAPSSRIWSTNSALISSQPGSRATSASPASSCSTKCMSRKGALYSLMIPPKSLFQLLHQLGYDLEQVPDDAVVRDLED